VSLVTLPSFEFKAEFQALQGKVDSLLCAGHDGIFLIGSQDGSLQLWQRVEGGLPG
ncbi:ZFWD3, partial [Symbiodinium pilosum]